MVVCGQVCPNPANHSDMGGMFNKMRILASNRYHMFDGDVRGGRGDFFDSQEVQPGAGVREIASECTAGTAVDMKFSRPGVLTVE